MSGSLSLLLVVLLLAFLVSKLYLTDYDAVTELSIERVLQR